MIWKTSLQSLKCASNLHDCYAEERGTIWNGPSNIHSDSVDSQGRSLILCILEANPSVKYKVKTKQICLLFQTYNLEYNNELFLKRIRLHQFVAPPHGTLFSRYPST